VNGAIYIVKTELIETSNHPWGGKAVPFLMSPLESIDVDGQSQLTMVDLLISQKLKEGAPSA
jgi:CMP-N-acetylneuraminic acid synthetase